MEQYEIEHINQVRTLSAECMVLLKSDGRFPLKQAGKIALYGSGVRRTLKGGGGSGDVNVRSYPTIEQGLAQAGFEITTSSWLDQYDEVCRQEEERHIKIVKEKIAEIGFMGVFADMDRLEPEYTIPLDGDGDTAVYVLARNSCEGTDRQAKAGGLLINRNRDL